MNPAWSEPHVEASYSLSSGADETVKTPVLNNEVAAIRALFGPPPSAITDGAM
jgi:hypothetical protein